MHNREVVCDLGAVRPCRMLRTAPVQTGGFGRLSSEPDPRTFQFKFLARRLAWPKRTAPACKQVPPAGEAALNHE